MYILNNPEKFVHQNSLLIKITFHFQITFPQKPLHFVDCTTVLITVSMFFDVLTFQKLTTAHILCTTLIAINALECHFEGAAIELTQRMQQWRFDLFRTDMKLCFLQSPFHLGGMFVFHSSHCASTVFCVYLWSPLMPFRGCSNWVNTTNTVVSLSCWWWTYWWRLICFLFSIW